MSQRVLARRKIIARSSEGAILQGYRLAFTLKSTLATEPRFANVEPSPTDRVHGVLHSLKPEDMQQLIREEGGGRSYKVHELELKTYSGKIVKGNVFILPLDHPVHSTDESPSARYLSLLIHGAVEHKLDESFIQQLRSIVPAKLPVFEMTEEIKQKISARKIPLSEVEDKNSGKTYVTVKGIVFDFTADVSYIKNIYGSKDVTLQVASFLCDSECPMPQNSGQLTKLHKEYIQGLIAAFLLYGIPIVGSQIENGPDTYSF